MENEAEGRGGKGKRREKKGEHGMRGKEEWVGRKKKEEKGEKGKKVRVSRE